MTISITKEEIKSLNYALDAIANYSLSLYDGLDQAEQRGDRGAIRDYKESIAKNDFAEAKVTNLYCKAGKKLQMAAYKR